MNTGSRSAAWRDAPRLLPSIRTISGHNQSNKKLRSKISNAKTSSKNINNERSESENRRSQTLPWDAADSRKFIADGRGGAKSTHGSRVKPLKKLKNNSDSKNNMADQFTVPYQRNTPSPPPPYSNHVPQGPMNRIQPAGVSTIDDESGNKQTMYPPEGHKLFGNNRKARNSWNAVKKNSKQVIPKTRRTSSVGCCTTYVSTINFVRNKKSLMLLLHCSLLLLLAGYIVIGTSIIMKIDGGKKYASRGQQEIERLRIIRATMSEKLVNTSLKSVLENSRDAVLDTIFTSDALQAALTVFKTSRIAFLPADHELELLGDEVLTDWETEMKKLLLKYHFISSMETSGYQLTKKEMKNIWDTHLDDSEPLTLPWTFWEATVQSFCLMSTIGYSSRSPSGGGKTAAIIYTIIGAPFYWWIIIIWGRRLMNILILITKTTNQSNIRKVSMSDDTRSPTPHWNGPSSSPKNEAPPLLLFIATILTIAYVIGIGPLGCGTPSNAFGERLEAAFLSLLTVRAPIPLPNGGESSIGFILYILIGHIVICTFLRSIKVTFTSMVTKIFDP